MTLDRISAVARRLLPFALVGLLIGAALALAYSLSAPKLYETSARILVEPRTASLTDQNAVVGSTQKDASIVDTEVEFLESGSVAERVVRRQGLMRDPEFGAATVEEAVDKFQDALAIRRAGLTALIDIAVASRSPERAARLSNATAAAYVELQKERKRGDTLAANKLLKDRVDGMAGELRAAEAAVQRYRIDNNLMSVNGATLAEQSASQIGDQLAEARARERAAQAELASAAAAPVGVDQANAQQSLGTLRARQAEARQEMSAAATKYGPRHPVYLAAQERLEQIDRSVSQEQARARAAVTAGRGQEVSRLRADAAAASNLRRSLEASAGQTAAGLARNSAASTRLADLERQAAAIRATYEAYLNRYQETLTQLGTERSDASVVSAAAVPTAPFRPSTTLNLLFGALAGLLTGLSLATILMLFESHLSTGQQIEELFDLEALPSLPTARSAGLVTERGSASSFDLARRMLDQPTGPFAEMHRNLLNALDRPVAGEPNRVVAITSTLPKEGKTTAALCLAAVSAQIGRRTLLIDADQRRRSVTRELAGGATVGLRDALKGTVPARDAIVECAIRSLHLLPATAGAAGATDVFRRDEVAALLESLKPHYDLVLIDTAPVLPIADTRIVAGAADSVLMVCRWRSTSRRALETALELLGRADAPIAGVSLTQVDLRRQARLGYGDEGFYYNQYKDYYLAPA